MPTRFRLRAILTEMGISQGELSRRSGVSIVTVSAIANNHTTMVKLETLDRLASALGIHPGALLERTPPDAGS